MSRIDPDIARLLDLYLDGQTDAAQTARVEAALSADPALRDAVQMQRGIDAGLRSMFSPVPAEVAVARSIVSARRLNWRTWSGLAAAAILLIGAIGAWWAIFIRVPRQGPLYDLYTSEVAHGFKPDKPCTSEAEFKDFTFYAVRQPMRVAPDAPGIEVVGWSYRGVFTPGTNALLARVNGHEVVLLMDRQVDCDVSIDAPRVPEKNSVHVFRRQVGSICVFELTTLEKPTVLSLLEAMPMPEAPPSP